MARCHAARVEDGTKTRVRERASPGNWTLHVTSPDGAKAVILREGIELTLGRKAPADLIVPDPELSRLHASITLREAGVWVRDLDSTNGTFVNEHAVEEAYVGPQDRVRIGSTLLLVEAPALPGLVPLESVKALVHWLRAQREEREPFALMMIRCDHNDPSCEWVHALRPVLPQQACLALYDPQRLLVAVREQRMNSADGLARRMLSSGRPLAVSLARCPADATRAAELIETVRRLDRSAPLGAVSRVEAKLISSEAGVVVAGSAFESVLELARKAAPSRLPVMVIGETGSGKELVAQAVHAHSGRKGETPICVNCATIPGNLVESLLFGHERGAFTGAAAAHAGYFEQADGGTLFLDEVGELSAHTQASLLRVLETGIVRRVGGNKEIPVDVRVVCATHRPLSSMVERGTFRQDLLYRLDSFRVDVPPLRQRREEIVALAEHFLARAHAAGEGSATAFADEASEAMRAYDWPGNIRELRNAVERAVVVAEGTLIHKADLPALDPASPTLDETPDLGPDARLKDRVRAYEANLVQASLERHGWDRAAAAAELQVPVRTLTYKIHSLGLEPDSEVQ